MAAVRSAAISAAAVVAPRGFGRRRRLVPCFAAPARGASGVTASASGKMLPRSALHASASTTGAPDSNEAAAFLVQESLVEAELSKLACPICYYPLVSSIDHQSAPSKSDSTLECSTCKKLFSKDDYWDLTVAVGSTEYSETMPAATELFRTQLVSFLYERGWRQNFIWGGFPGLEKEFEMAKDYLKPKSGGIIIDASCGSGLFSRLFVKSELYCLVVALDFSENMLKQCKEFIKQENISDERLVLVRADISRLPFVSGSIDALHAGAAIHCWPSPACAVAEISRVLRPGGVFVGSTFIADVLPPVIPLLRIGRPYIDQITGNNTFLSELELEDLCSACGLVNFTFVRNGFYIMFSATKAS
ncbi:unnamed protein product [Triticum turgidum subsp. durum]|uniref:Methyltransferase type 11 domain-containing protein n=1 Tax=Triticum turgidum subsp. durum TaxID=4567 RepID=A0A9R0Y543_TRITD|nr:unnamed protein product [Triticum turgidum subsp. durum]